MNNTKKIKIVIELPTWLGDCIMSTPAIENIISHFHDTEITMIGSLNSTEVFKNHPKVSKLISLESRYSSLLRFSFQTNTYDYFFTFRGSFRAKLLMTMVKAKSKYQYIKKKFPHQHQVEKYNDFINQSLGTRFIASQLVIHEETFSKNIKSKLLGINPGASYGSAKRWYPEKFARVAIECSKKFDIIIFGGTHEQEFAKKIENLLIKNNIHNYTNLAGKTTISELIKHIATLNIFITGDSGPMHIAASLQIPTISLFGPTNSIETSQWKNPNSMILKKNLDCQPCMKKKCPLDHHNCMKLINASEVVESISKITKKIS